MRSSASTFSLFKSLHRSIYPFERIEQNPVTDFPLAIRANCFDHARRVGTGNQLWNGNGGIDRIVSHNHHISGIQRNGLDVQEHLSGAWCWLRYVVDEM